MYFLGDIHLKNAGCDVKAFQQKVKDIVNDPFGYWLGMGDMSEYIGFTDPRFEAISVQGDEKIQAWEDWAFKQTHDVFKEIEPIKDKCIGLHWGNHEKNVAKYHGYNPAKHLAGMLGVKFLMYEAMTRIYVNDKRGQSRYSLAVYSHHGYGGGKLPGGHALNLYRLAAHYDADIYALGHVHRIMAFPSVRLGITSRGQYSKKPMVFLNTGTYLKSKQEGIEGYEVKIGYPPVPIGCPVINVSYDDKEGFRLEPVLCQR